jgi:predicted acetyltransferase
MGVLPEQQGKGLSGSLLVPMLARLDKKGVPCVLETNAPQNVPLYERYGFITLGTTHIPDLGVPLWTMWRDVVPGSPDLGSRRGAAAKGS